MNKQTFAAIFSFFDELFPNASCELNYTKDYTLLIAVILSAQTTDKSVNLVTPGLFEKFPSIEAIANADVSIIETHIRSIGLFHTKALNIKKCCQEIAVRFQGKVPFDKEDLMSLPGVGAKTANVVRAELFQIPEIAVDTHVARISKRLYFAQPKDSVDIIEKKLRKIVPEARYIKTHHQMIHFGRYFCKAIHPQCDQCHLRAICRKIKEETI